MRIAILSDIHGNLVALETVLADLEALGGADLTWCLGDLAMGGSRPSECVQRIKALTEANEGKTFQTIGGNTDRYLVNGERFRQASAKNAEDLQKLIAGWEQRDTIINWNARQLSWDDYEFLKKLRGREIWHEVEGYGFVIGYHAVPGNDESMLRPDTSDEEAADFVLDREGCLGVGGHTHLQMNRIVGHWLLLNVGSVGLSFDNPGYAQYGILDFEGDNVKVDLRNIPYDVDAAVEDLYAAGHPVPQWIETKIRKD